MNRRKTLKVLSTLPLLSTLGFGKALCIGDIGLSTGTLPEVFVLGDSISIHYGPYLERLLSGWARYSRKQAETINGLKVGANGGNSKLALDYLKLKLADPAFKPDVVLLNFGLHDIKREVPVNQFQVSIQDYRRHLRESIALLFDRNIGVVWVSITPVVDEIHNSRVTAFKRFSADVDTYNAAADQLCASLNVPILDLFTFTSQLPERPETKYIDNVHYNENTRILQASYIAGYLQCLFGREPL